MNVDTAWETGWRPFEPSREAVDEARRESDENRCAVGGWSMSPGRGPSGPHDAGYPCRPGNCSVRPRPERLYAPERAEREAREVREIHERALRNGMPPSGRWA